MKWLTGLMLVVAVQGPAWAADPAELARARAALVKAPAIDGHNDVPWQILQQRKGSLAGFDFARLTGPERTSFHTDLERLKAGGWGGVFWSVYVPAELGRDEAVRVTFEQIDTAKRLIALNPQAMQLATTAGEVRAAMKAGRVASLLGAEGGHSIGNSMGALRALHAAGVRYMTITHSKNNDWADSATDEPKLGGLSDFGRAVIGEMNRLGMLVDLSHVSPETMADALDVAAAPVIFSHSSARAITDHPRNVPDEILKRLPRNGGIVMVTFVLPFDSEAYRQWSARRSGEEARLKALYPQSKARVADELAGWERANPAPAVSSKDVADHVDHIRKLAGIDHIGIGSDFDGVPALPADLNGADTLPNLFAELVRRGYSDADLAKIAQGNLLRVMERAEAVAARLEKERGPSEARFEAAAR